MINDGAVPDGLEEVMNRVVIARNGLFGYGYEVIGTLELDENRFCGIGMYIPYKVKKDNWNTYYETLSWYNAVGWGQYETSLTDN